MCYHNSVTVIIGDAKDRASLVTAFANKDTVISVVGGPELPTIHRNVVEAAVEAKVANVIATGGAGALPAAEGTGKTYNCIMRAFIIISSSPAVCVCACVGVH